MDTVSYVALTRQTGLLKEMQLVANNIANMATTGFRAEGVVFTEMVQSIEAEGNSVAMTGARVRFTDMTQGALAPTGGTYDLGIQGEAFFQVETPAGPRLTRSGAFSVSAASELVTMQGYPVLDAGGAPVFVPPDAQTVTIARDGTMAVDGAAAAQIGLFEVEFPDDLKREGNNLFVTDQELLPSESATVMQGFLENSNVNPVTEITRMIEVQRSYELGQKLLDSDNERIREVVRVLGAAA